MVVHNLCRDSASEISCEWMTAMGSRLQDSKIVETPHIDTVTGKEPVQDGRGLESGGRTQRVAVQIDKKCYARGPECAGYAKGTAQRPEIGGHRHLDRRGVGLQLIKSADGSSSRTGRPSLVYLCASSGSLC